MAGRGPAPGMNPAAKDPARRVRRSRPEPVRVVRVEAVPQPSLPEGVVWPDRTVEWWAMWGASPLAAEFTATDWSELLDTAFLHARFWGGDVRLAAELRLRVGKFGATPEDRARLRITFAQADQAESRGSKVPPVGARGEYGVLKAVD